MSDLIFDADSADKAARTLEFLESFRSHPDANGKVCLHGGTALNLFVLTPERLSLDADINYIGECAADEMAPVRDALENASWLLRENSDIPRALEEAGMRDAPSS